MVGGVQRRHDEFLSLSSAFVSIGNEGHGGDAQRQALPAHFGEHLRAGGGERGRQIAHRDRRIEARAEAAGGDLADRLAMTLRPRTAARLRAPARGLPASGRRGGAARRFRTARESCPRPENRRRGRRRCGGSSGSTIPARPRPASSWCRCRGRRGKARPRAAGCRARRARSAARRCCPAALSRKRFGLLGRNRNLKAVLAGIAGARDEAVDAVDAARPGIHEAHRRVLPGKASPAPIRPSVPAARSARGRAAAR